MVFSYPEAVDAYLLGEHALGDDVSQRLRLRHRTALIIDNDVAEGIETHFKHAQS